MLRTSTFCRIKVFEHLNTDCVQVLACASVAVEGTRTRSTTAKHRYSCTHALQCRHVEIGPIAENVRTLLECYLRYVNRVDLLNLVAGLFPNALSMVCVKTHAVRFSSWKDRVVEIKRTAWAPQVTWISQKLSTICPHKPSDINVELGQHIFSSL